MKKYSLLIFLCVLTLTVKSYDNGVGKTPPMGWNSWDAFGCDVNETGIK